MTQGLCSACTLEAWLQLQELLYGRACTTVGNFVDVNNPCHGVHPRLKQNAFTILCTIHTYSPSPQHTTQTEVSVTVFTCEVCGSAWVPLAESKVW